MTKNAMFLSLLAFCIIREIDCVTNLGHVGPVMILSPDHQITVKEGQSLEVNCSVKDSHHAEKWQIPYWRPRGKVYGTIHQNITSYNTVTLFFQRIHKSDAGIYKCCYNTTKDVITRNLYIIVGSRSSDGATCASNQFICEKTRHCIALSYRCNDIQDCEDGSDEANCKDLCVNKFRCLNGKCISPELVCDKHHEDNCGDASDEYCQLLTVSEQTKADSGNTTIDATITPNDHMTWLKTTLYVVIGCTVSVVFFISVIVVAVFRIRMKRNSNRRRYGSPENRRNQREYECSQLNYQAADPFLNMAPSANYGNIIVNVNNGIQYVPGAEFSEITAIMEAPPSYSDVEQEIYDAQNIPPPDYSTIDRNPLRVNNINSSRSQGQSTRPQTSGQSSRQQPGLQSSNNNRRERNLDSRPRTQNAAVQTLTHRSQRPRSHSSTESSMPQLNLNVQGGQILLTNVSNVPDSSTTQVSPNEMSIQTDRPSSAVLQILNGQIVLSNPNLDTVESEHLECERRNATSLPLEMSGLEYHSDFNIDRNPPLDNNESDQCQDTVENIPQTSGENNTDTNETETTPHSNIIQVLEGEVILSNEETSALPTGSSVENERSAANEGQNRGHLGVCDGQIILTSQRTNT